MTPSEEELQKMLKELEELASVVGVDPSPWAQSLSPAPSEEIKGWRTYNPTGTSIQFMDKCEHEWVSYTGVLEVYNFCSRCDEKKYD